MDTSLSAADLAAQLSGASSYAIAADVIALIRTGAIAPGTRLPTVRALAVELEVSPSTISAAWQTLRDRGEVTGRGRAGIAVATTAPTPRPKRYEATLQREPDVRILLSTFGPDRNLLPDLYEALERSKGCATSDETHSYNRDRITPSLEAAVRETWPYPPRSVMAVSGGYDALRLCLNTFVRRGDWVLVENPCPPRMLDLVESVGARAFALERDDQGVTPASLARGLGLGPAACIIQTGIHNPTGVVMTARRRDELAGLLEDTSMLLVEDDGSGSLFDEPIRTFAERVRGPHLYVRSYSKSHGPDLRLAVIEGAEEYVAKVHSYFGYGAGWVSRPLQEALAWMLRDPQTQGIVQRARDEYGERREALRKALRSRGVQVMPSVGFGFIVLVRDEAHAHRLLGEQGVAVFRANPVQPTSGKSWIRVSVTQLHLHDVERVADILASACL